MKFLVTSGGTIVPLDEVRRIQNMSSGRFGSKIATVALEMGHKVDFLYAHNSATPFDFHFDFQKEEERSILAVHRLLKAEAFYFAHARNYVPLEYKTFYEYHRHLETLVVGGKPDVVLLAAAVSDYGPAPDALNHLMNPRGKISSNQDELVVKLKPLPKIISQVKQWNPSVFLVGFKLLVDAAPDELEKAARKQIESAGSDLVVANDLRDLKRGTHRLYLYTKQHKHGVLKVLGGRDVAKSLVEEIQHLAVERVN